MFKRILNLRKDELIRGSLILFIMINIFNLLNYVFHFTMARMLSIEDYGILVVLMSFVYIFSIPTEAIQAIISRYTSKFRNNEGKIKNLFLKSLKKGLRVALLFYIIFIPIALFFSYFLEIDFLLMALIGLILFAAFSVPVIRGVLQGKKRFTNLGLSMDLESVGKIIFSVLFVYLLHSVYGAVFGLIGAVLITFFLSLIFIKDIMNQKEKKMGVNGIRSYSWPVFILLLSIILMYSLDVIIAKRFFSPEMAGKYAVASMLGKMIFFGTNGIGKAMFPISSEKKKHEKRGVFKKSLIITCLLCLIAVLAFLLFPELIIKILFGSKYLEISNIIVYTGLAFSFLSVANLIVLHKLSHDKIKKPYFMLVFVLLEIILLSLFNQNILNFCISLTVANFFILVGSLFIKN